MLQNLINWEHENGFKARFVAEKLGLSESQYSLIKNGKRKPPLEMAGKMRDVFGVKDPIDLLTEKGGD